MARKVNRIVEPPTASGSSAETALRNTNRVSRKSSGNAISSARAMSDATWSPTAGAAIAPPPSVTQGSSASAASIRGRAPAGSFLNVASRYVERPSRETSRRSPPGS